MTQWHGWKLIYKSFENPKVANTNGSVHVGPLPNRKGIALYREQDGILRALAYFVSEQAAQEALAFFDRMATRAGMNEPPAAVRDSG